jgi:site-specific DNA-methyltransferase (adenine-specific)
LLFVVPSRWFAGGKGLDKFRKMMLARKDISFIHHIDDASSVFGSNVSIEGGVNYFMVDREYSGLCDYNGTMTDLSGLDILTDSRYSSLINKAIQYPSLSSIYRGRRFGIETNDPRLTDDTRLTHCFVSQSKGGVKYIDSSHLKNSDPSWKVITARANGKQKKFGNTFVGSPTQVHTGSYISFDVASESEAMSLTSYLRSKFANKMLGLRKVSQDINESTCKWIPLPPLDRMWTDADIHEYYQLTPEFIALLD